MDTREFSDYNEQPARRQQYIGCIGVKISMRSLSHQTRSDVAKESIKRLCEANNIKANLDKSRLSNIARMLDDEPNLVHAGEEVRICVTSDHLNVVSTSPPHKTYFMHEMPNVSFASSGDEATAEFLAYVAKDTKYGRACFVFELGCETARFVLRQIALAFKLRTKQILYNTKSSSSTLYSDKSFKTTLHSPDSPDALGGNYNSNENAWSEKTIAATRSLLEKEPWFHGSYLSREESETRLKHEGDFLVRESMLDPGHFVLSVLHNGTKLHLSFDSMGQVRTKEKIFNDISHLVKYHHGEESPIIAEDRIIYLLNGVRPTSRT